MQGQRAGLLFASLLFVGTACDGPETGGATGDTKVSARDSTPGSAVHDATGGHGADSAAGETLLPIMQRLGTSMSALTHGLMTEDHEAVSRHAAAIAAHAPISAAEIERIRRVLGSDMHAFEALDESVHVASVRLRDAAQDRRPALVVERLGTVQRGCVSCHAQFRARLRTTAAR